jgi:hypothetical protein
MHADHEESDEVLVTSGTAAVTASTPTELTGGKGAEEDAMKSDTPQQVSLV